MAILSLALLPLPWRQSAWSSLSSSFIRRKLKLRQILHCSSAFIAISAYLCAYRITPCVELLAELGPRAIGVFCLTGAAKGPPATLDPDARWALPMSRGVAENIRR